MDLTLQILIVFYALILENKFEAHNPPIILNINLTDVMVTEKRDFAWQIDHLKLWKTPVIEPIYSKHLTSLKDG